MITLPEKQDSFSPAGGLLHCNTESLPEGQNRQDEFHEKSVCLDSVQKKSEIIRIPGKKEKHHPDNGG